MTGQMTQRETEIFRFGSDSPMRGSSLITYAERRLEFRVFFPDHRPRRQINPMEMHFGVE